MLGNVLRPEGLPAVPAGSKQSVETNTTVKPRAVRIAPSLRSEPDCSVIPTVLSFGCSSQDLALVLPESLGDPGHVGDVLIEPHPVQGQRLRIPQSLCARRYPRSLAQGHRRAPRIAVSTPSRPTASRPFGATAPRPPASTERPSAASPRPVRSGRPGRR